LHWQPVMRLSDVMTTPVETLPLATPAETAWERMRLGRIRHLLIVDPDGRVEGVLTQRDLGGPHGAAIRANTTVDQLMARPVVTASPTTTVREAANLLRGRTIGCLPVVRRGRPVGIITATDLLELIGRGAERPVAKTRRWTLKHRGPRRRVVDGRT
jgi:CBS domain-containing protein